MTVRRCHKEKELVERIEGSLGVSVRPVQCHIVDERGMSEVLGKAGWGRNLSETVIGFQIGSSVYVLESAPWTVLHELIHRSGINADRMNRYVAEGLTEAIAIELKRAPDEHQPTYPEETAWIQQKLLPRLGLTAVGLGRQLVASDDPVRLLADLIVAKDPGLDRDELVDELRPQRPGAPKINSGKGSLSRATLGASRPNIAGCRRGSKSRPGPDRITESFSALLVLAGVALGLPLAIQKLDGRSR